MRCPSSPVFSSVVPVRSPSLRLVDRHLRPPGDPCDKLPGTDGLGSVPGIVSTPEPDAPSVGKGTPASSSSVAAGERRRPAGDASREGQGRVSHSPARDIMTRVASTTVEPTARPHGLPWRPSMVSVGTIVWLASELMFFAALFAAYFTIRSHAPGLWAQESANLNVPYASGTPRSWCCRSVTCQMGVFAAERGEVGRTGCRLNFRKWGLREWFILDLRHGCGVRGRSGVRVRPPHPRRHRLSTNGYGSIFYLATGFHGLHVTGGLIAFLLVLGRTYMARRFTHEQAVSAIVVSYYWHFVDVVWIALFATIYVLK